MVIGDNILIHRYNEIRNTTQKKIRATTTKNIERFCLVRVNTTHITMFCLSTKTVGLISKRLG